MNQTLTSLVNDVYTLTNRPDLVGETTLAVRNATLKAHSSDFYYKDLFETGIVFDFAQAQQSLDYKEFIPRWRAAKYLRKYTPSNLPQADGTPGAFLELVTPDQLLDSYNYQRNNVYYVAGTQLQIRSSEAQQYFLLGCYLYPDVTPDTYCSWVATEQPAAILYAAASIVFKTIGYDEQVSMYERLVQEEYAALQRNNLVAVGY